LDDPESEISVIRSRHQVTVRKPEKGTLPALFYIDGDLASLQPTATDVNLEAAWNSQTRGVGHYARYLQSRESGHRLSSEHSGPSPVAGNQASSVRVLDSLEKLLRLGDDQTGVLQPASLQASPKYGQQVATEVSRRTYDAPQKGTLWGWQVAGYMWTKSIAAGAAIVALWADFVTRFNTAGICREIGVIVALVFLALTGALLAGDLDQPKRFLYVMLRPQWRSWLVRGAYVILAYSIALLFWLAISILQMRSWLVDVGVIALAAATAAYTAFLFAQAKARDFWQSPLLGVHMLIHAMLAGGACFLLGLPWATNEIWITYVRGVVLISLAAKIACDVLELATTHATSDASKTAQLILRGFYWRHYWIGAIGLGVVAPALVLVLLSKSLAPIAGLAVLVGIYVSEHVWVRAPQRIPLA
jgi:formate-dependent nitrite reductase membrane component NrfD